MSTYLTYDRLPSTGGNGTPVESQLAMFTRETIRATEKATFSAGAALIALAAREARTVSAADLGGDKLAACYYSTSSGRLRPDLETATTLRSRDGLGYLDVLEERAKRAVADAVPFGVSYAGPLDGSRVIAGRNLGVFLGDLRARYDGDFQQMHASSTVVNDGVAGLLASALEAERRFPGAESVILLINGSGLNTAVLHCGRVYATESGHVPLHETLNVFGQTKQCGMYPQQYTCIENLAASRAGIEDIWARETGVRVDGREIAAALESGDELARDLYTHSALLCAHVVLGVARALRLGAGLRDTVLVGHGGSFEVSGYMQLLQSILEHWLNTRISCFRSKTFAPNACLDGAAIAALMSEQGILL